MPTNPIYYPVWLSQGATPPYMTGKPCDTTKEAQTELARIMRDYDERGFSSAFGCVVRYDPQRGKHLIMQSIRPADARLGARHLIGILDQHGAEPLRE